jgi:hypothetical protein
MDTFFWMWLKPISQKARWRGAVLQRATATMLQYPWHQMVVNFNNTLVFVWMFCRYDFVVLSFVLQWLDFVLIWLRPQNKASEAIRYSNFTSFKKFAVLRPFAILILLVLKREIFSDRSRSRLSAGRSRTDPLSGQEKWTSGSGWIFYKHSNFLRLIYSSAPPAICLGYAEDCANAGRPYHNS